MPRHVNKPWMVGLFHGCVLAAVEAAVGLTLRGKLSRVARERKPWYHRSQSWKEKCCLCLMVCLQTAGADRRQLLQSTQWWMKMSVQIEDSRVSVFVSLTHDWAHDAGRNESQSDKSDEIVHKTGQDLIQKLDYQLAKIFLGPRCAHIWINGAMYELIKPFTDICIHVCRYSPIWKLFLCRINIVKKLCIYVYILLYFTIFLLL